MHFVVNSTILGHIAVGRELLKLKVDEVIQSSFWLIWQIHSVKQVLWREKCVLWQVWSAIKVLLVFGPVY